MSDRDDSREEVEHPSHYQSDGIECIDAMYAISPAMAVNFAVCSALKYLDRAGLKDDEVQDLMKAKECWHMAKRMMAMKAVEDGMCRLPLPFLTYISIHLYTLRCKRES